MEVFWNKKCTHPRRAFVSHTIPAGLSIKQKKPDKYRHFSPCLIQLIISFRMIYPPSKQLHYTWYIFLVKKFFLLYVNFCNSSGGFSVWFRFVSIKNAAIRMRTGFFLSDPYNFSVGYGYKTNFLCRNRSFLRATTDPNAIFYRRTVV